jgi:hypothetical protein
LLRYCLAFCLPQIRKEAQLTKRNVRYGALITKKFEQRRYSQAC